MSQGDKQKNPVCRHDSWRITEKSSSPPWVTRTNRKILFVAMSHGDKQKNPVCRHDSQRRTEKSSLIFKSYALLDFPLFFISDAPYIVWGISIYQCIHVLVIMSCNAFISVFKLGLLENFVMHSSQERVQHGLQFSVAQFFYKTK